MVILVLVIAAALLNEQLAVSSGTLCPSEINRPVRALVLAVIAVIVRVGSPVGFDVVQVSPGHAAERPLGRAGHLSVVDERALQRVHVLELGATSETRFVCYEVLAHAVSFLQIAEIVDVYRVLFLLD